MNNSKALQSIQNRLDALQISLRQNLEIVESLQGQIKGLVNTDQPTPKKSKKPKKNLIVTMPDKTVILYSTGVDAFRQVIHKVGIEKVQSHNIMRLGCPLVAPYPSDTPYQQRESVCGKYWITTHGSTEEKATCLRDIATRLKINMSVKVVEAK